MKEEQAAMEKRSNEFNKELVSANYASALS